MYQLKAAEDFPEVIWEVISNRLSSLSILGSSTVSQAKIPRHQFLASTTRSVRLPGPVGNQVPIETSTRIMVAQQISFSCLNRDSARFSIDLDF